MENKEVRTNNWLIDGISEEQIQKEKTLAIIGAKINLKRLELGMDQKEFAKLMGVSQGMVSRWESGEYNFSVATLSLICKKLDLTLDIKSKSEKRENMIFVAQSFRGNKEWKAWEPSGECVLKGGVA